MAARLITVHGGKSCLSEWVMAYTIPNLKGKT